MVSCATFGRTPTDVHPHPYSSMRLLIFTCLALTMLGHTGVHAQNEPKLSATYATCIDKAGAMESAVIECMANEHALQDKRLNSNYRALIAQLSAERKKQLQETQRLWLKYSEANCDFYHDPNGGTATRTMAIECQVKAKAARAAELKALAR